jgi:ABC-type nitrate/sulfonate/bicarbonate transport system permease component
LSTNWIVTVKEVMLGLGLAFAVAMVFGFIIAHNRILKLALYPPLIASQTLPIIAIAPILVIWFGYNTLPKVLITALIAFFPLTINTIHGYGLVTAEHHKFFRSLGANRFQTFWKLELPTALPQIFAGLKISATLAVIGATVAEWVGADRGLGHIIVDASTQLDTRLVFAAILLLSISGMTLFCVVALLERLLLPWVRHQYSSPTER